MIEIPICTQHVHRRCTAGAACPYSHDLANSCRQHAVCAYYLNGGCTKGTACTHKHMTHVEFRALIAASPPPPPAAPAPVPIAAGGAGGARSSTSAAGSGMKSDRIVSPPLYTPLIAHTARTAPGCHGASVGGHAVRSAVAAAGASTEPRQPRSDALVPTVRAHKPLAMDAGTSLLPKYGRDGLTLRTRTAGGTTITVHEAMVPVGSSAKPHKLTSIRIELS